MEGHKGKWSELYETKHMYTQEQLPPSHHQIKAATHVICHTVLMVHWLYGLK